MRRWPGVTLVLLAVAGCQGRHEEPGTPSRARVLRESVVARTEQQRAAVTHLDAAGRGRRTPARDEGRQILFGDLGIVPMSPPESVVVVSPLSNEAKLRVTVAGGKSADIRMVREGTAWKVDLMGSLEDAPDLSAQLGQGSARTSTSTPSVNSE